MPSSNPGTTKAASAHKFLSESFGVGAIAHHTRETNSIGHAKTHGD